MIQEGQITLFAFPQTDQASGKLRPTLILRSLPSPHSKKVSNTLPNFIPAKLIYLAGFL